MSFFKKLKSVFQKLTSQNDCDGIEEMLIEADFGIKLSEKLAKQISKGKEPTETLKQEIELILEPLIAEIEVTRGDKPFVIVLEGVNGSGKTTTAAKLAYYLKKKGYSVDIAACDTFRAAATDQLETWANRVGCKLFKSETPKDPASVAFEALSNSKSDVLIIDTAGRLQNNSNLMNELSKIHRVIKKIAETAPQMTVLVLDATTGQNMVDQVAEFQKVHPISGIIINKLDGNAKGGTLVRVADEFKLPILGVGIGESEKDLEMFSTEKFLKDLMR